MSEQGRRFEALIIGGHRMSGWSWPRVYRGNLYRGAPLKRGETSWHICWENAEKRWRCVFAQAGPWRGWIGWRIA